MGKPVVHFEVYGPNAKELQDFYAQAFEWEIHADNPMNYGLVHTNAGDKGIDGGVAEGQSRVNFMIEVPDLEAAISKGNLWEARSRRRSPRSPTWSRSPSSATRRATSSGS